MNQKYIAFWGFEAFSHLLLVFLDSMASGDDDDEDGRREDFQGDLSEDPVYIYQGECSLVQMTN